MNLTLRRIVAPADAGSARELFQEYERSLGVSLCFQNFDQELQTLPGRYAPPRGGLWVAFVKDLPAGCVALRPFLDSHDAELKRLFVRPAHRGTGLGRHLLSIALDTARSLGFEGVRLDTLPSMTQAAGMYRRAGFVQCTPWNPNDPPGTLYFRLALRPSAAAV